MHLEKPKCLITWNGGSSKYYERCISLNETCIHNLIIEYNKLPMI